ncbi:MAG: hypothetical protein SFX72_16250 [Isosphaeraceae bacterium]|nr:hypothetical protein [Isosphaeraceae bacterium]
MTRLELCCRDWRDHCEVLLRGFLQESPESADRSVRRWAAETLVPECFDWMKSQGLWPKIWTDRPSTLETAKSQIRAASQNLTEPSPTSTTKRMELAPWSVPAAAAMGSFVGMLACAPLSLILTGDRFMGLTLGGIGGGALGSSVIAWLASRPRIRTALEAALAAGGAMSLIGALWSTITGKARVGSWIQSAVLMLGCTLLLALSRPRLVDVPNAPIDRSETRRLLALQAVDLVLAWTWAHPDRQPVVEAAGESAEIPSVFLDAMTHLKCGLQLDDPNAREVYTDEMIHQYRLAGYEWHFVANGSAFDEAMRALFDPFSFTPDLGDPVRTIEPGITVDGRCVKRGKLQRLRKS